MPTGCGKRPSAYYSLLFFSACCSSVNAFSPYRGPPLLWQRASTATSPLLFQSSVGIDIDTSSTAVDPSISSSELKVTKSVSLEEAEDVTPSHSMEKPILPVQPSELTVKILNGVLLAASFGFAAYTILNIDHGMTRGWTQSEIALRIPLDNWLNYESSLSNSPIFTKTTINVIIYLLGDWLSQTVFCGKNILDFDAGRTLRNGFIGLCFGPLVHEYYQFSDHILPVEGGMWNRLEKILMDQTVYLTVKCSIYVAAVGLLQGDDVNTVKTTVQTKLPNIVLTSWRFWPAIHAITYSLIPARHRILWVNCVDLVWNAILASMSQKTADEETAATTTVTVTVLASDEDAPGSEPPVAMEVDTNVVATAVTDQGEAVVDPFLLQQSVVPSEKPDSLFEELGRNETEAVFENNEDALTISNKE